MLIFWRGTWHNVDLPAYMDPSWNTTQQTRLALAILKGRATGKGPETVFAETEALVLGEKHGTPKDRKEEA